MSEERSPEELLQSALSSAFTPVSVAPEASSRLESTPSTTSTAAAEATEASTSVPATLVTGEEREKYEQERAALEQSWKEQSAIQRREAEERRAKIAAERAARGETWEKLAEQEGYKIKGPPNPIFNPKNPAGTGEGEKKGYPGQPSVVDARDVVSGEPSRSRRAEASAQVSPQSPGPLEHSQHWEEVDSLESSYPSLSFPDHSRSGSAPSSEHDPHSKSASKFGKSVHSKDQSSSEKPAASAQETAGLLPSTTLSIFDSRLSKRTRFISLLSSLSINLLLPFINGVMLGFGEIFARNMASRFFGWQIPGSSQSEAGQKSRGPGGTATAVGVRASGSVDEAGNRSRRLTAPGERWN